MMSEKVQRNFDRAKRRGFVCACCRQKPPVSSFHYDVSGVLCLNCHFTLRIAAIMAIGGVLLYLAA